tara:strand:- start:30492 stop:30962 length:471 start_codon:yes stop_codon:yes gene_type:complete
MSQSSDRHIHSLDLACYHAVHAYPGGVKAVAAVFGWNPATLQNKLNPTQGTHKLLAAEVEQVLMLTRDARILDAICAPVNALWLWGDEFAGVSGDMGMLDNVTQLMTRVGELTRSIHDSLADGQIDHDEMRTLQHLMYRLMQSGQGVLQRAEEFAG